MIEENTVYSADNSVLDILVHRIIMEDEEDVEFVASLFNKHNNVYYETNTFKIRKAILEFWKPSVNM